MELELALKHIATLAKRIDGTINIMEVCGTHTVAIFRHGIRNLLPDNIRLISGPGCPVCVTSIADIDRAIEIARRDDVILATFGDMMRVPGSKQSLIDARAGGSHIEIVYSPMDCLSIARKDPQKKIVFFATGFETTSPSVAATIDMAEREAIDNFFIYTVHKIVPPAIRLLAANREISIAGLLLPGHVSTIIGRNAYRFLSDEYRIPSVIAGFGAEDILHSILRVMKQIASGTSKVEIQYKGAVQEQGNPKALEYLDRYFQPVDAHWRGIGIIEKSGLAVREEHAARDILRILPIEIENVREPSACRCGDVLIGKILPSECKLFGRSCTPQKPVGACMVSSEGSCAAYYKYGVPAWTE